MLSLLRDQEGCLMLNLVDTCYQWTQLNPNEIQSNGWNTIQRVPESTQCGVVALFCGFNKTRANTVISRTILNIPEHFTIKIQYLMAKIDSWDNEYFSLKFRWC
ncbi:unnamed protein product [Paramecium octaurelia]|uniref:Uncharacterized protein n=1 Tax=Paramecium octaurelia TaxID=43137 RepID=A0A8S1X030_PAROT|nr:unnamed protein product [Paramecium octaurelia]